MPMSTLVTAKFLFGMFGKTIIGLFVVGGGLIWGAHKLDQRKAKKAQRPLDGVVEDNIRLSPY